MYFDSTQVDMSAGQAFELLPKGEYLLTVDTAAEKNTKANTGKFVAVSFEVIGGTFTGRKLFSNFNIVNPSEKAQNIGRAQFAAFCTALGVPKLKSVDDLAALSGRTLFASVDIEIRKDTKEKQNKITAFRSRTAAKPVTTSPSTDDIEF